MKTNIAARLLAGALLTAPLLAGCGGSGSSGTTNNAPPPVSARLSNGLTGTLAEDQSIVSAGSAIKYTFTLTNNTTQAITYRPIIAGAQPSGGVPASLTITDSAGNRAYPITLSGLIEIGSATTLAPGQSIQGTLAVPVGGATGLARGRYHATAAFSVDVGDTGTAQASATVGPLTVQVQ